MKSPACIALCMEDGFEGNIEAIRARGGGHLPALPPLRLKEYAKAARKPSRRLFLEVGFQTFVCKSGLRFSGKNARISYHTSRKGVSMAAPLADRVRPATLDQVVGQQHILGPGRALRKIIEAGEVPNMVFYGPAGVGKTTVASIIAKNTKRHLVKLNGTTASTADIKEAVASTNTLRESTACCSIWTRFNTSTRSSSKPCWSLWRTAPSL